MVIAVIGPGYAEHVLRIRIESFPIIFVTPAIIGLALGGFIIGSFLHGKSKSMLLQNSDFIDGDFHSLLYLTVQKSNQEQ